MAPPSRLEFWADYLHSSRLVTNTVLVTGDGGRKVLHISEIYILNVCTHKATHAVLLAATSSLLADLLGSNDDTKKVVILPDFSVRQVRQGGVVILSADCYQNIALVLVSGSVGKYKATSGNIFKKGTNVFLSIVKDLFI